MGGNRGRTWLGPEEGYPLRKGGLDEVWPEGEIQTSVSSCRQLLSRLHQNSFVKPQFDTVPGAI